MRGKITQWKEDKGFGFIVSEDNGEKIFFHVSDVKNKGRRPQENDVVIYQSVLDSQGRLKAKSVVIEGVMPSSKTYNKKQTHVDLPKKDALDYLAIFLLIGSLLSVGYSFIQSSNLESLMPAGIMIVIAVLLLNRQKKPKEKTFSCSRCRKMSNHGKRTISAWQSGFYKLYCNSCHQKWLSDKPKQTQHDFTSNRGCLGMLALLVLLPIMVSAVGVYQWVA